MPRSQLLLLLLLLLSLLTATLTVANSASNATAACKSSFYPKLCRALLKPLKFPTTNPNYDYGRYSVKQALKQAKKTSKILDHYLSKSNNRRNDNAGALEDCRQLAAMNAEYLEGVKGLLGEKERVMGRAGVERVKALMSAVVTNQQTCYDGLEASRTFPELSGTFQNETKLYGVSLELVASALVGKGGKPPASGGELESETGRKLADADVEVSPVQLIESVLVAQDGTGNFTTINEAIAYAPNDTSVDDGYIGIFISSGVYQENVLVPKNKKNLIFFGAGMDQTIVTGNRSVIDGWTTFNSATFAVQGDRFIAIDMTFENTAGPEKHQAVAVRNSADLSSFYRCKFDGYQDTLYAHSLRQFYRDCDIYGTVDFIFGNAASVFQDCRIFARKPLPFQNNMITAQGRIHPNQTTGISIHNCTVRPAPDLQADMGSTQTFLGRPWKEYSRTVYMQSYIDGFVDPAGWREWNSTFALSTLYYGEFDNTGPGADTSRRVQWEGYKLMDVTQAWNFTVYNFTTGDVWLPTTPIPYQGGLV